MKKILICAAMAMLMAVKASADEGMWLLPFLNQNVKDMQAKGLRISPEEIYNANGSSLKDAIVIFGRGCTGEIVSPNGLLFTNHHCGYGNIQALSSVEHDYLKNGFWAMSHQEELPSPGLEVRFIRHIADVTDQILTEATIGASQAELEILTAENTGELLVKLNEQYPGMEVSVRPFFGGNQYIMFAMEVYPDVRLVGAPPASIGKFGGETDNWMWPRHTGDFSIFRVYADADGRPAEYSKDNVPYQAPVHLSVSTKGYEEGDFAMIMGFPGSTNRYMTSWEIDQVLDTDNPTRIYIRGTRQDILKKYMQASDLTQIQYADKYAMSSNYWKNSIGMSRGLRNLNVKAKKEAEQRAFTDWVNASPSRARYANALPLIEEAVKGRTPYAHISQYMAETMLNAVEIINISGIEQAITNPMFEDPELYASLMESVDEFYKDYDPVIDRDVAKAMFKIVFDSLPENVFPQERKQEYISQYGSVNGLVDYIYDNSVFPYREKLDTVLESKDYTILTDDPASKLRNMVVDVYLTNRTEMEQYNQKFREGHRLYIAGLMEMEPDKMHYPDANFTIRLTYGNVLPYSPADGVIYDYYTNLKGVIAKEDLSNPGEFTVPERLKELYYAKDFGPYAYNGDVPVGFLSTNDITGGNSGSPVLNGDGHLIGLAFDGNWEAMSGDIAFEPDLQRTINVDVRYVLFVIDKFAGAGYLLDEMTIVR